MRHSRPNDRCQWVSMTWRTGSDETVFTPSSVSLVSERRWSSTISTPLSPGRISTLELVPISTETFPPSG